MKVTWDDELPNGKIKFMFQSPPTRSSIIPELILNQQSYLAARRLSHSHQSQLSIQLLLIRRKADGQTIALQRSLDLQGQNLSLENLSPWPFQKKKKAPKKGLEIMLSLENWH